MPVQSIGSTLLRTGILSRTDYDAILKNLSPHPAAFAKGVVALGVMTDKALAAVLARETRVPCVVGELSAMIDRTSIANYDWQLMTMLECVPLKTEQGRLVVAVADPTDRLSIRKLEFCLGAKVSLMIAPISEIHDCLAQIVSNFRPEITPFEKFLADHAEVAGQVETSETGASSGTNAKGMFDFDAARADESEFVAMDDITIGTEDTAFESATIELPKIDGDDFQNSPELSVELPVNDSAVEIPESALASAGTETVPQVEIEEVLEMVPPEEQASLAEVTAAEVIAESVPSALEVSTREHGASVTAEINLEFAESVPAVAAAPEPGIAENESVSVEPAQYSQTLAQLNLAVLTVSGGGSSWLNQARLNLEPHFPIWGLFNREGQLQMGWPDAVQALSAQEVDSLCDPTDSVRELSEAMSLKERGAKYVFASKDKQAILVFSSPAWASNCEKPLRRLVNALAKRLLRAT